MPLKFGKSKKKLLSEARSSELLLRLKKDEEERMKKAVEQEKPELDLYKCSKKSKQKIKQEKSRDVFKNKANEIFCDRLGSSLGLVVFKSVENRLPSEAKTGVITGISSLVKELVSSGNINFETMDLSNAPHTEAYLANILAISKIQAAEELATEQYDNAKSDLYNEAITEFEQVLSDVIDAKIDIMLQNEKNSQLRLEEERQYALENALDPDKYMAKKLKNRESLFQTIMESHVKGSINSKKEVSNSHILLESIITYAFLEALHTSKIATRAELYSL